MRIRTYLVSVLLLAGVTFAAFFPSLNNGFVNLDDDVMLTENRAVHSLTVRNVREYFLKPYCGLYHPLVQLSYAVEYRCFGPAPRAYHVTNLLLHVANTLLVYAVLLLLCGDGLTALLAALLFGIHPLHVESVAWISERKDVLNAFFFLASLAAWLIFRRRGERKFYYYSLLLFLLSLLSKAMAVTLPVLLLLFDYFDRRKASLELLKEKFPFFALSAIFAVITLASHYNPANVPLQGAPLPSFNLFQGMLNAACGTVFYMVKLLVPVHLSCVYPYADAAWAQFYPALWVPAAVLALLALAAAYSLRRSRTPVFGALFFLAAIFPVLQFIPFGQKVPADRYTYLPAIGLFFAAAAGISFLLRRLQGRGRTLAVSALVLLFALCAATTARRCLVWKDSLTLWSDVVARHPAFAKGYKGRADAFKELGRYELALQDYDQALRLRPGYASALNNRGNAYARRGDLGKAFSDYNEALRLAPGYAEALYNRGLAFAASGRFAAAIDDYSRVLASSPGNVTALNNRATAFGRIGRFDLAVRDLSLAISLDPALSEARQNRALALLVFGDREGARRDIEYLKGRGYPVRARLLQLYAESEGR